MSVKVLIDPSLVTFSELFEAAVKEGYLMSDKIDEYPNHAWAYTATMRKDSSPSQVEVDVSKNKLEVMHPFFGQALEIVQAYILKGYSVDLSIDAYPRQYQQYVFTMVKNATNDIAEEAPQEAPKRGRKAAK